MRRLVFSVCKSGYIASYANINGTIFVTCVQESSKIPIVLSLGIGIPVAILICIGIMCYCCHLVKATSVQNISR